MIEKIITALENAKRMNKKLLVIRGAGTKAFCAGGDIRALASAAKEYVDIYGCGFVFIKFETIL